MHPADSSPTGEAFPLSALIALALAGFVTILTEALPAALLPQIAADLSVSHSSVGQMVTVYAIGSLVAAFPYERYTRRQPSSPRSALIFEKSTLPCRFRATPIVLGQ